MDSKEKVLTLASAARKVGLDPDELKQLIYDGKLDAVETEGGNLLIGEESLKGIIKEIQSTELSHQEVSNLIPDDIKILLSQAATFIERQEEELKVYRDREENYISLLKGAEKQISKTLDQLNVLYLHNLNLNKENRKILQKLITIQSKDNI